MISRVFTFLASSFRVDESAEREMELIAWDKPQARQVRPAGEPRDDKLLGPAGTDPAQPDHNLIVGQY
jgi:hypothetical protein